MDENNNTNEHTTKVTEVISSGITHGGDGADAPKDHNAHPKEETKEGTRDGDAKGTYTAPSAQSPVDRRPMTEERTSHFPRRNVNPQRPGGFQRNNFGGGGGGGNKPRGGGTYRPFRKEKYDKIAAEKIVIDYKHPEILRRFLTEGGKILSRYVTGNSAKNQRRLVKEVKRSRFVGLLPSA